MVDGGDRETERERSDFLAFQLQIKRSARFEGPGDAEAARESRSTARSLCAPHGRQARGMNF